MLEEKTQNAVDASRTAQQTPRRTSVTAPGALFGLREDMHRGERRLAELEAALERHQGAFPTRKLDPKRIRISRWSNRHAASFRGAAYEALKSDIQSAGGNVQPIKVRPVEAEEGEAYEIVFGHRRHRACLELGLEVLATIAAMDDAALFAEMDRENRQREDLSPYELGRHYKQALDEKLWTSQSQLAAALGVTQGYVSQALTLAELPEDVVNAFPSPLDIQVRWGLALSKRLRTDGARVAAALRRLEGSKEQLSPRKVYEALVEEGEGERVRVRDLKISGKRLATFTYRDGEVFVSFQRGAVPAGRHAALERVIREVLQTKEEGHD
jgi:ParB family chromosome partitioning protein